MKEKQVSVTMKNIILTGFMASGKTTIGKCLSEKLNMSFIDTDEYIEKNEGMTINEIFSSFGEKHFRKLEEKCAKELCTTSGTIIATGGGFVLNKSNIDNLRKNGVIVNLKTNEVVIRKRLDGARGTRPLLQNNELDTIMQRFEQRKPYYDNCDIQIELNCNDLPEQYADRIINKLKNTKERKTEI